MKISKAIEILTEIQVKYGDIDITGGYMTDDVPLSTITVTDTKGYQIWPTDPFGLYPEGKDADGNPPKIDGVFLQ